MNKTMTALLLGSCAALTQVPVQAQAQQAGGDTPKQPAWVTRSNAQSQLLLDTYARFQPELAGWFGAPGLDERVIDMGPAIADRVHAAFTATADELDARLKDEKDPRVRQDLEILRNDARRNADDAAIEQRYLLPNFDVAKHMFFGTQVLLNSQVASERQPAVVTRLNRYAGLEEGYTPLATMAEARLREQLGTLGLLFPLRSDVEQQLASSTVYLDGIGKLLDQYKIRGGNKPLKALREQIAAWDAFLRAEVLPKAREDFRLPPEYYAQQIRDVGVDIPAAELASRARTAFIEIRNQMVALAPLVARERQLSVSTYPEVIRALRQQQVGNDAILPMYESHLATIEQIIRRERLVSLPERAAIIRLATPAESAAQPAPQLLPPRLIDNQGERGQFVLPLAMPSTDGKTPGAQLTDFSFDAATWTITAHEVRPGHELQFARMVEGGVSLARALFAFNSVNVEGWALYAEAETQPYLPLDGQLIALQFRLLRAARAFLDPGLQSGDISLEEARRVLVDDVVITDAFADQELQRYTFRAPGQATSYFYGYQRLLDLRARCEVALGKAFDRQRFHDFVLDQGLLPPDMLAKAVMTGFVPAELQRVTSEAAEKPASGKYQF